MKPKKPTKKERRAKLWAIVCRNLEEIVRAQSQLSRCLYELKPKSGSEK